MNNFTMNAYEMKRDLLNFSKKISHGVNQPTTKFVMDMQFVLAKSGSCLISEIARSLNESIKLNYTIERLCVNLSNMYDDESNIIWSNYLKKVKRNQDRFPNDFYFQLNENEYLNLKSQIGTANLNEHGGVRKMPYVFTEQGVAMLATVIRTDVAAKVSIDIMRAFVRMRHYIKYNEQLLPRKYLLLEEKVDNNTKRIDELFDKFNPKVIAKNSIFFKNDIYDAYSVLLEIFDIAKEEIIIIDNYMGKVLLDKLRNINRKIVVISSNIDKTLIKKYIKQYNNVTFINNDSYHDRFIIIDRKRVFHCGVSFKDLGKKCFAINEIENKIENGKLINDVIKNCSIDN